MGVENLTLRKLLGKTISFIKIDHISFTRCVTRMNEKGLAHKKQTDEMNEQIHIFNHWKSRRVWVFTMTRSL